MDFARICAIMDFIKITKENLEKEHICCAISNNKDIQVASKKAWIANSLNEGLVFLKSTERVHSCRKSMVSCLGERIHAHKLFLGFWFA